MRQAADPRVVVVDASVALKWAFDDEEHVAQALALRDDFLVRGTVALAAPGLFVYELVNGICSAINRHRLERSLGSQVLQVMAEIQVDLRAPQMGRMFEIALDCGLSAYDSSYLALAEALAADLLTADRLLFERGREKFPRVRWIGDYPL
jgi:predicted nucleic acid-binding protein